MLCKFGLLWGLVLLRLCAEVSKHVLYSIVVDVCTLLCWLTTAVEFHFTAEIRLNQCKATYYYTAMAGLGKLSL